MPAPIRVAGASAEERQRVLFDVTLPSVAKDQLVPFAISFGASADIAFEYIQRSSVVPFTLASPAPADLPQFGFSACYHIASHAIFIFGGAKARWFGKVSASNALFKLDLVTKDLTEVKIVSHLPSARYNHAAACSASTMFIHGGTGDSQETLGEVLAFDMEKLTWQKMTEGTASTLVPMASHTLLFDGKNRQLIAVEGDPVWTFSLDKKEWKKVFDCARHDPELAQREQQVVALAVEPVHHRPVILRFGGSTKNGGCFADLVALVIGEHSGWLSLRGFSSLPPLSNTASFTEIASNTLRIWGTECLDPNRPFTGLYSLPLDDILRSVGQLGLSGEPSSTFSLPSVEPRKATVSITAATPKARSGATLTRFGNDLLLWGGEERSVLGGTRYPGEFTLFQASKGSWAPVPSSKMPQGAMQASAAEHPTSGVTIVGGRQVGMIMGSTLLDHAFYLQPNLFWDSTASFRSARFGHSMVWMNHSLLLFGGSDIKTTFGDFWKGTTYESGKSQIYEWRNETNAFYGSLPEARAEHCMVNFGGLIIAFGGKDSNGQSLDSLFVLEGNSWKRAVPKFSSSSSPQSRFAHSCSVADDGSLYIFGGVHIDEHGNEKVMGDLWRLDLHTFSWQKINVSPSLTPRQRASMASLPSSIIGGGALYLFGGLDPNGNLLDEFWSIPLPGSRSSSPDADASSSHSSTTTSSPSPAQKNVKIQSNFDGSAFESAAALAEENIRELSEVQSDPSGRDHVASHTQLHRERVKCALVENNHHFIPISGSMSLPTASSQLEKMIRELQGRLQAEQALVKDQEDFDGSWRLLTSRRASSRPLYEAALTAHSQLSLRANVTRNVVNTRNDLLAQLKQLDEGSSQSALRLLKEEVESLGKSKKADEATVAEATHSLSAINTQLLSNSAELKELSDFVKNGNEITLTLQSRYDSLRQKPQELEIAVAKKEKEKRSLEGKKVRVQAAHAKLAEARQKLAQYASMTDAEREQLDRFMRSEQNLKRTEMEFLDSLNDLDNLDDEDEENADSPNSKNSMKGDEKPTISDVEREKQRILEAEKRRRQYEATIQEKDSTIRDKEAEITRALMAVERDLIDLKSQLDLATREAKEVESLLQGAKDKLASARERLPELTKKDGEFQRRHVDAKQRLTELEERLTKTSELLSQRSAALTAQNHELALSGKRRVELEERLRAVEGELRAKWEAMQQEVNTFRLHRDAWTSAFSEIDQLTQTVEKSVESLLQSSDEALKKGVDYDLCPCPRCAVDRPQPSPAPPQ